MTFSWKRNRTETEFPKWNFHNLIWIFLTHSPFDFAKKHHLGCWYCHSPRCQNPEALLWSVVGWQSRQSVGKLWNLIQKNSSRVWRQICKFQFFQEHCVDLIDFFEKKLFFKFCGFFSSLCCEGCCPRINMENWLINFLDFPMRMTTKFSLHFFR